MKWFWRVIFCILGGVSAASPAIRNQDPEAFLKGIKIHVMGSVEISPEEMERTRDHGLEYLLSMRCRFTWQENGWALWEFPMREAVIYMRQTGRMLTFGKTDRYGDCWLALPLVPEGIELVLATGFGTELAVYRLDDLSTDEDGALQIPYSFSRDSLSCCHIKNKEKISGTEKGIQRQAVCCNDRGRGCIDDNGPFAPDWTACSGWLSAYYNSDCFYARFFNDGRCCEEGLICRPDEGKGCSLLIGHDSCWHWHRED